MTAMFNTDAEGAPHHSEAMIDHIGYPVIDIERARTFYEAALRPLGYHHLFDPGAEQDSSNPYYGFGPEGNPQFWIWASGAVKAGTHIAFRAKSRPEVVAFYEAALKAGAIDNGAPGLRPHYHPHYFGAFVIDPDGYNVEAVCHDAA